MVAENYVESFLFLPESDFSVISSKDKDNIKLYYTTLYTLSSAWCVSHIAFCSIRPA
jgi:hypothetical protein